MFPQFSEVNLMLHFMVIDHIYLPAWFEDHDLTSSQILTTRTILSGAILTFNLCVINLTQCQSETYLAVLYEGVSQSSVCLFLSTESHSKGSDVCPCCGQRPWSWTSGEYKSKICERCYCVGLQLMFMITSFLLYFIKCQKNSHHTFPEARVASSNCFFAQSTVQNRKS